MGDKALRQFRFCDKNMSDLNQHCGICVNGKYCFIALLVGDDLADSIKDQFGSSGMAWGNELEDNGRCLMPDFFIQHFQNLEFMRCVRNG